MFFTVAGKTVNDKCTGVCEPIEKGTLLNQHQKNRTNILCRRCGSVVFPANSVRYITNEKKPLKTMSVGGEDKKAREEQVQWWWFTENDLDFDTVGWQTIDGKKCLMCGDCEFGPFGLRSDDNKKFYVAVERMKYP